MSDLPSGAAAEMHLVFDASVRRVDDGQVVIGGSPLRILRLTAAGADLVDRWSAGGRVGTGQGARRLARRLLAGGLAHPDWSAADPPFTPADVTVVIPAFDRPDELARTLAAVRADGPDRIVVVDDASVDAAAIAAVTSGAGAELVRRPVNGGPGAARNAGLEVVTTPLVAFVDCDVEVAPGWLALLLAHFADLAVSAVAPRVVPRLEPAMATGATYPVLSRFELDRSPLDLGPAAARVAPRTRVAYVPTTALVVRTAALDAVGGFDESLTVGEDVDLVWRLIEGGGVVRYEPSALVSHPPRPDLGRWLRQRFDYGTSAAQLAVRHPGDLAPLSVSAWSAAAWGLAVAGYPVPGVAVAATAAGLLPRRLPRLAHPWAEALRLAGWGTWAAWRPLSAAVTRTWWPLALGASLVSRRARRAVVAAAVVPPLVDWWQGERAVDPLRYVALRLLDDTAYGAGVWAGCARERSWEPLRPDLRSWPGRGSAAAR